MSGLQLSDDAIMAAMKEIPGYLDISTEDFRQVYSLARRHAEAELFGGLSADGLMRTGIEALRPAMHLDQAAALMARQGIKGLPVIDEHSRVVGMLTETDFLRRLRADTFLELLLRLIRDPDGFSHRCHESTVAEAMVSPAVCIHPEAGFKEILDAFASHPGRSMAVVDSQGGLLGLLMRKDFLHASHPEAAP